MKSKHIRILFLVIIAMMFMSLLGRWEQTFPPKSQDTEKSKQVESSHYDTNDKHSSTQVNKNIDKNKSSLEKYNSHKNVLINTKLFKNLKVSLLNGSIISVALNDYNVSLKDKTAMNLLNSKKGEEYYANSVLVLDGKPLDINYKDSGLKKQDNKQVLTLVGKAKGLEITRKYTFFDDKYDMKISQEIKNNTGKTVSLITDNSMVRDFDKDSNGFSLLNAHSYTFTGVAYSTPSEKFRKDSFKDIAKTDGQAKIVKSDGQSWVAFIQHYFMTAWIPTDKNSTIYYKKLGEDTFTAGQYNAISIDSGASASTGSVLYTGPIIKSNLQHLAPNLEKSLDYGMLSFFSEIIFWVMNHIHSLVGNWGLAIILVTIIIKAIFYPLSAKSYKSMAKMRMLQPRMKILQEQYKEDRQALGRKMMEMYKEEKVNPLSGCLPMIVQIPIFISLYWVLLESVELRQSPFIFWIHDLSVKDPFYVLPILMGLSMFLQQRLSPAPADPVQAKVMMFLPVMFTFLFSSFPAGLVLYWLTNNVISIMQQYFITKQFEKSYKSRK